MSQNQTISVKDISPTNNKLRSRKEQRDAAQEFISTIQGVVPKFKPNLSRRITC